jgi:hypothetical protein
VSNTRASLHQLVDALPDDRLEEAKTVLLSLAAADGDVVIPWEAVHQALRTSPPATEAEGEGTLDALLVDDPELRRQLEESLQDIKAGQPLIAHEAVKRMINSATDG